MANGPATRTRTTPPQPLSPAGARAESEEGPAVSTGAEAAGESQAGADEPAWGWDPGAHPLEQACAYLRQVHGQVNYFQRNDGTELVRVKAEGFAYDGATLVEATALLKARIDRYASRRLKGNR